MIENLLVQFLRPGPSDRLVLDLLNMSITASIAILFVLAVRFLLKKAPKKYAYLSWSVVLFRLLVPFSPESDLSLLPTAQVFPDEILSSSNRYEWTVSTGSQTVDSIINPILYETSPVSFWDGFSVFTLVWALGAAGMLLWSAVSCIRLRKDLVGAVRLQENVYLADRIASPFVLGLFRAKIYLPSSMPKEQREFVLLHEKTHIRRWDPLWRALSFLALALHWFNPLVWLAFRLSGTDMEMSCDEAVMEKMSQDVRGDYAACLLEMASGRRAFAGMPLAFGEDNAKARIKNILSYKKPALWLILLAAVMLLSLGIGLLTNPTVPGTLPSEEKIIEVLRKAEAIYQPGNDSLLPIARQEVMIGDRYYDEIADRNLIGTVYNERGIEQLMSAAVLETPLFLEQDGKLYRASPMADSYAVSCYDEIHNVRVIHRDGSRFLCEAEVTVRYKSGETHRTVMQSVLVQQSDLLMVEQIGMPFYSNFDSIETNESIVSSYPAQEGAPKEESSPVYLVSDVLFPAYEEGKTEHNAFLYEIDPFTMRFEMPEDWELRLPDPQERSMGTPVLLEQKGEVIGSVSYSVFQLYDGWEQMPKGDLWQMVYSDIRLGSVSMWDYDRVVRHEGNAESAIATHVWKEPVDGQSAAAWPEKSEPGVLFYDLDRKVYVMISFAEGKAPEDSVLEQMAMSIQLLDGDSGYTQSSANPSRLGLSQVSEELKADALRQVRKHLEAKLSSDEMIERFTIEDVEIDQNQMDLVINTYLNDPSYGYEAEDVRKRFLIVKTRSDVDFVSDTLSWNSLETPMQNGKYVWKFFVLFDPQGKYDRLGKLNGGDWEWIDSSFSTYDSPALTEAELAELFPSLSDGAVLALSDPALRMPAEQAGGEAQLNRWKETVRSKKTAYLYVCNMHDAAGVFPADRSEQVLQALKGAQPGIYENLPNPATGGAVHVIAFDGGGQELFHVSYTGNWFTVQFGEENISYVFDGEKDASLRNLPDLIAK